MKLIDFEYYTILIVGALVLSIWTFNKIKRKTKS